MNFLLNYYLIIFRSKNKVVFDVIYIKELLYICEPIKVIINTLKSEVFKNKNLILISKEIIYLNIISIFVKTATNL
jgi:hypothetical protein